MRLHISESIGNGSTLRFPTVWCFTYGYISNADECGHGLVLGFGLVHRTYQYVTGQLHIVIILFFPEFWSSLKKDMSSQPLGWENYSESIYSGRRRHPAHFAISLAPSNPRFSKFGTQGFKHRSFCWCDLELPIPSAKRPKARILARKSPLSCLKKCFSARAADIGRRILIS